MAAGKPGPVVVDRYRDALAGDDPLEVMAQTPDRLAKLVSRLSEKLLTKRSEPGKWSIKEVIAHLCDGEVILGSRYRMVAAHDRPALPGYDQDAFVERLGVDRASTADLLSDFSMARAVNLGLLDRLAPEAFSRVGIHSERGEESIESMVSMYAGHDRIHLAQVERLRRALRPPSARAKKKAAPATSPRRGARKA